MCQRTAWPSSIFRCAPRTASNRRESTPFATWSVVYLYEQRKLPAGVAAGVGVTRVHRITLCASGSPEATPSGYRSRRSRQLVRDRHAVPPNASNAPSVAATWMKSRRLSAMCDPVTHDDEVPEARREVVRSSVRHRVRTRRLSRRRRIHRPLVGDPAHLPADQAGHGPGQEPAGAGKMSLKRTTDVRDAPGRSGWIGRSARSRPWKNPSRRRTSRCRCREGCSRFRRRNW